MGITTWTISILIYLWIFVINVTSIPDYLMPQKDGTTCLSMRYTFPWTSDIEVDRFILKDEYRLINGELFLNNKLLKLRDLFRSVQNIMATNTRGVMLIIEKDISGYATSEIVSHFLCANELPNPNVRHHVILAFHMCKANIVETQKTGLFVRNIAGKLAYELPEIGNYILSKTTVRMNIERSRCAADPVSCIDLAIIQPLKLAHELLPYYKRIILVSGLDECDHMVHGNHISIPRLLAMKINDFPPWTKFLFISRNVGRVLNLFPNFQKYIIKEEVLITHEADVTSKTGGAYSSHFSDLRQIMRTDNMPRIEMEGFSFSDKYMWRIITTSFFAVLAVEICLGMIRLMFPDNTDYLVSISIHVAAFNGYISSVREHIRRGCNINDVHAILGLTPLHLAAINGHYRLCNFLLENGADANIVILPRSYNEIMSYSHGNFYRNDLRNATAIKLATLFGHPDTVMSLLNSTMETEIGKCLRLASMRLANNRQNLENVLITYIERTLKNKYKSLNLKVTYCYVDGNRRHRRFLAHSKYLVQMVEGRICDVEFLIQNPRIINDREIFENFRGRYIEESYRILIEDAIQQHSETLFKNHSNLNVISGSGVKSLKASSVLRNEPCIVLYCSSKGNIPYEENPFPKMLRIGNKHLEVDVREGYFSLCPGGITMSEWNNPLRIGASIGRKGGSSGTLGPFVELSDGSLGFITCAHVFPSDNPGKDVEVVQPSDSSFAGMDITDEDKKCGFLFKKVFDPTQEISIDAALVKVETRCPERALFTIGSTEELLETGFDSEERPTFDNAYIKERIDPIDVKKTIIKFGCKTGLTRGAFRLKGCSVRIAEQTPFNSPNVVMKNQYEILSIGPTNFFQPGDSGSAVFLVDDNNQLHCIGIAIGCTSYNSAIVTPIVPVLNALGLPKRLKSFTHEQMSE